ncbi:uncharacterized protein LOC114532074 [Dendronephthya gigantea]|uniref:uncharacterized protein LOC114532074 n=1 Tax=Dendronephthya gigantea TaxID=151771 RepID=UPI00106B936B|nr:uncharacterized protein LOC114532074 [Dendronephthya gigantea]XP_028409466.1 uncharacterized protein LOC114532074 [Dendronephthya gigantea]
MAEKPFTKEELNFFKFASIVLNEFPKLLRQTFIIMWDNRIAPFPGCHVWDDSPAVRNLLLIREGGKTNIPTNKSINEWDCTALFQAIIYSKIFGLTTTKATETLSQQYLKKKPNPFHSTLISPTGKQDESLTLAIDQLRLLRNILCHIPKPFLTKIEFDQYVQVAKDAFAVIGVASDRIDEISCLGEEDFPTNKMNELNERIKDELQQCNKFLENEVIQKLSDQEENMDLVFQKLDEIKENIKSSGRVSGKECVSLNSGSESEKKVDDPSVIGTALKNEKTSIMAAESPGISTESKLTELSRLMGCSSEEVKRDCKTETEPLDSFREKTKFPIPASVERPAEKTWKSKLYEYCQRIKVEPKCYETKDERTGEFTGFITILDKTFESTGSFPTKKVAKEIAAKIAMEYFNGLSSESGTGSNVNEKEGACREISTTVEDDTVSLTSMKPASQLQRPIGCSSEEVEFDNNTEIERPESFREKTKFPITPSVERPAEKTWKSKFYEYCQRIKVEPKCYETKDECTGEFTGFITIDKLDKIFESIGSFPNKKVAKEMAAKTAMEYFNGLSSESGTGSNVNEEEGACREISTTVEDDTVSLTSMKPASQPKLSELAENQNLRSQITPSRKTATNPLESNDGKTWKSILNDYGQSIGAEITSEDILSTNVRKEVAFRCVVKILDKSFETVENYSSKKTAKEMTAKEAVLYLRAYSSLKRCLEKRNLDYSLGFVTTQNPITNKYSSKIYLGKRCFKGKEPKFTRNEAEIHVIETAIDTFDGRSDKPGQYFQDSLKLYHEEIGCEAFPKYEVAKSSDNGNFICEVKVKKKYEFICEERKTSKTDVQNYLAERAVKTLEDEKVTTPVSADAKIWLTYFLQNQDGETKLKYELQEESGKFYGSLYFYVVVSFESLTSQATKEEAIASSAMSACNAIMNQP